MKKVYMAMSTDIIHTGHINIINKAKLLGELTIGVYTDDVVAMMDRYLLIPTEERIAIISNIKGVDKVIIQDSISYKKVISELKPDIIVHGDDWKSNNSVKIREEVIQLLGEYGGELVEFPYTYSTSISNLEKAANDRLGVPEIRRPRLRRLLQSKKTISIIEAHSGLTGLIAETVFANCGNVKKQFDGMWVSSLCDSTMKGKPDIELVDFTSRIRTIDEIMEVTTKPIILDCDSGGLIEHFEYNIRTLERIGVSAGIIEDKVGLKKNSLFGAEAGQQQDSIEGFCAKINAGKKALRTKDFMLIARIESLILEQGMDDAINRAFAYVNAGADGIMIHSRKKSPSEIFEFCDRLKTKYPNVPIVVVPTTFNSVTETEWAAKGINIVIYANHLIRSAFPAMVNVAKTILQNGRCMEADDMCMSIKDILQLIPANS